MPYQIPPVEESSRGNDPRRIPPVRRGIPPVLEARYPDGELPPPPMEGGATIPPVVASPQPEPSAGLRGAGGRMKADNEDIRLLMQERLPKPSMGRKIAGTVATVLGSMVNPQLGALGEKILHPGRADWEDRMARATALQDLNQSEARRLADLAQTESLIESREASAQQRRQSEEDRIANQANVEEGRLLQHGAEFLPARISAPPEVKTTSIPAPGAADVYNFPKVGTRVTPGVNIKPGDQIDPATGKPYRDMGEVREIRSTGNRLQSTMLVPNQQTRQDRKTASTVAEAETKRTIEQKDWVPVTDEIVKRFPALGYKVGDKIPRTELQSLATKDQPTNDWEVKSETDAKGNVWEWRVNRRDGTSTEPVNKGPLGKKQQPPASTISLNGGQSPEAFRRMANLTTRLKSEPANKNFNDIKAAFDGIREAANDSTGVSDITLLRLFAKLTDPTTGVREEEYRTMQGAQGLVAQMQTWLPRVANGERLTPETRKQFAGVAQRIYNNRNRDYQRVLGGYKKQAEAAGIDPSLILMDLTADDQPQAAPPTINTKAEFDALPSGAVYIDNGKQFKKP